MKSSSLDKNGLTSGSFPFAYLLSPQIHTFRVWICYGKAQTFPGLTTADFLCITGWMWLHEVWERVRTAALWLVSTLMILCLGSGTSSLESKWDSFSKEEGMYARYATLCTSFLPSPVQRKRLRWYLYPFYPPINTNKNDCWEVRKVVEIGGKQLRFYYRNIGLWFQMELGE